MAKRFAKIGVEASANKVISCENANDKDCENSEGVFEESIGQAFMESISGWPANLWIYSPDSGRGHLANIDDDWDAAQDIFIAQQPFPSWVLDTATGQWDAPIPEPALTPEEIAAGKKYGWDEALYESDNTKGFVLYQSGPPV